MKILAIESSAVTASVALLTEEILTAEYTINYKKTHSQTLLPMIDEICKMTETDVASIDYYAVSVGPGSFTGLRIGVATGKGLALSMKKDMVAVPTLEALAYNLYGTEAVICPIMDAKRKHLYTAMYAFTSEGKLETLQEKALLSYEDLAANVNALGREVIFVGDGIAAAKAFLDEHVLNAKYAPVHMNSQRAASVAMAALQRIEAGDILPADQLKPDYLRPSQAERELELRLQAEQK